MRELHRDANVMREHHRGGNVMREHHRGGNVMRADAALNNYAVRALVLHLRIERALLDVSPKFYGEL